MTWSPWYDHDHSGFPVPVGTYVERQFISAIDKMAGKHGASVTPTNRAEGPIVFDEKMNWCGGGLLKNGSIAPAIIRYRIRSGKGFETLEQLVRNARPVLRPVGQPEDIA